MANAVDVLECLSTFTLSDNPFSPELFESFQVV